MVPDKCNIWRIYLFVPLVRNQIFNRSQRGRVTQTGRLESRNRASWNFHDNPKQMAHFQYIWSVMSLFADIYMSLPILSLVLVHPCKLIVLRIVAQRPLIVCCHGNTGTFLKPSCKEENIITYMTYSRGELHSIQLFVYGPNSQITNMGPHTAIKPEQM